jgi:hypothetical protein
MSGVGLQAGKRMIAQAHARQARLAKAVVLFARFAADVIGLPRNFIASRDCSIQVNPPHGKGRIKPL